MNFFFCVNRTDFFFAFFTASIESDSFFLFARFFRPFLGSDRFFKIFFPFFSPGFLSARYFFAKIRSAISFFSPLLFPFYRNRFFFAVLGGIRSTACFFFFCFFATLGIGNFFRCFFYLTDDGRTFYFYNSRE